MITVARDGRVSLPVTVELAREPEAVQVLAELRYSPRDPYAVVLAFSFANVLDVETGEVDPDSATEWRLTRDFLATGQPADLPCGDLRITRGTPPAPAHVELYPASPSAQTLTIPYEPLEEFLAAAYAAVPRGSERQDIDGLLRDLNDLT